MYVCMYSVQKCLLPVWLHVCPYISRCQAGAKFCKEYKSHTVPARRDGIFIMALLWGHINNIQYQTRGVQPLGSVLHVYCL